MLKKAKEKAFKAFSLGLMSLLSCGLLMSNSTITASAHNAYFLSVTIDEGSFRYVPTVIYEENSWVSGNHRESDLGNFTEKTVNDDGTVNDFQVPSIDYSQEDDSIEKSYSDLVTDGDGDKAMAFTFPGLHGRNFKVERKHATSVDEDRANYMAEHLVGDLNSAIDFCLSSAGQKKSYSIDKCKNFAVELANGASKAQKGGSANITLGDTTFTLTSAKNTITPIDGAKAEDYILITASNGASMPAICNASKGYRDRKDISEDYKESLNEYKDPENLNWKYIVLQGNYNADVKEITFSSVTEVVKPSAVSLAIGEFFGSMLSGLRNFLGLYSLNDIFLNTGTRDNLYYYGLMPKTWMSSAVLLNIVCLIIAVSILGFAILKLLFKRQTQTMNIGERVSLMEGFKDLLITAFALASFVLVFNMLVRVNYSLVKIFGASSEFANTIGTTQAMSTAVFATIIINFAFFVITIYFNFVYVLRAFTVAVLYGIAPIAIVCISFGSKYKQIFSNYVKELVSNIYLQTFHAMCVAFFTNVTATGQMRTFETFVVLCAFIPLTKFVREAILGLPAGITDEAQGITKMAMGAGLAVAGGIASNINGKSFGDSKSFGGESRSNIGSPINGKIEESINNRTPVTPKKDGLMSSIKNKTNDAFNTKFGDNSDLISNEELFKDMDDINTANSSQKLSSNNGFDARTGKVNTKMTPSKSAIGKALAGGVVHSTAGLAKAGLSMGMGMIGDSKGSGIMMGSAGMSFNRALNGFASANAPSYDSFNSSADSHGGKTYYNSGENQTIVYDTDKEGNFKNPALRESDYGHNFKEMVDAFKGTGDYAEDGDKADYRTQAINYYKSQGIKGVGYMDKDKGIAVVSDKSVANKRGYDYRTNITPYKPRNPQTQVDMTPSSEKGNN